jgi:hypothetical protein
MLRQLHGSPPREAVIAAAPSCQLEVQGYAVPRSRHSLVIPIGLLLVATAPIALAGGDPVVVTIVDGRKAKAQINLPKPGGGVYSADFELEFHNPINLTVECVGISADVLDAIEIADIESRLPDPGQQIIDPAFPVRVTVEPPAACGLEFEDEVHIEFDTPELVYTAFSPYRLVKAPVGGAFGDLTERVEAGSVRSRGSGGAFSEFVMIKDLNQDYASEATQTFATLEARLVDQAIAPTAKATLQSDAGIGRAAFQAGDYAQAIARLTDLTDHCGTLGGAALPNRWRSTRDLGNAQGEIVGISNHLKFLLGRLNGNP